MMRVEPLRFVVDADLEGVLELPVLVIGNVASLGRFPTRFNSTVYATESGLWRLYLWNAGLFKRRVRP